jgi:phage-related protein
MGIYVFTWVPDTTCKVTTKPRLNSASYGDGYSQDVPDGINSVVRSWSLSFKTRTADEALQMQDFLDARAGAQAFFWTDPYGRLGRWKCKTWDLTPKAGLLAEGTAVFDQVFDLPTDGYTAVLNPSAVIG